MKTFAILGAAAAIVQPCHSLGQIDDSLPVLYYPYYFLVIIFVVALVSALFYLFYPAYIIAGGGMGCSLTVLAGDGGTNIQGENSCLARNSSHLFSF